MADVEEIPEEGEGEETEVPDSPVLNLEKLANEAERRYERMKANPNRRGDPDLTYSAHVLGVLDAEEQAISNCLQADADTWVEKSEATGIGADAKKRLLAAKVQAGDFDK